MSVRHAILNNVKWVTTGRVLEALVKAAAIILLARLLGPVEFGNIILVLSIVSLLALFSDLGLSPALARYINDAPTTGPSALRTALVVLLPVLTIVVISILLFIEPLSRLLNADQLPQYRWPLVLLLIAAIGRKLIAKTFEGLRRVDLESKVSVITGWIPWLLALVLVLVATPLAKWSLTGLAIGNLALVVVLALVLPLALRHQDSRLQNTSTWQLIRYALPMIATTAGFYVYTQSDIILIQYFLTVEDVGIYGMAVRLLDILHVPAAAIGTSVAVFFIHLKRTNPEEASRLFQSVTRGLLLLYVPVAVGMLVLARDLIPLVFGSQYGPATLVVMVYAPFLLLKALSGTYALALDYLGFATERAIAVSVSAIANIGLNVVLIPRYGILGAAIATQATYAPLALWYAWLLSRESRSVFPTSQTLRILFASSLAGITTHLTSSIFSPHIFCTAIAFIALCIIFGLLVGAINKKDMHMFNPYVKSNAKEWPNLP